LNLLETASCGVYPQLNASASLKQLRINLDSKPTSAFRPTFALKIQRELLTIPDSDLRRSQGAYQNPSKADTDDIIVEWVEYDKEDIDGRLNHIRRIDDLARMAHSASDRHPDLHTIDCLGYMDDSTRSRYGLVYKAPEKSFLTLNSLITSNDLRTPDLGDRFKLAHTLAIALWSLHSLDWLHKSLSSNNILFFPSAFSTSATKATAVSATVPDISSPYLLGFDASRPDHLTEVSVASKNPSSMDLHRHPHSLDGLEKKPYCKSYDIYSLGLVLLEIGLWKVLQAYYKPHYNAEKFRDRVVLSVLVPGLGSKTGGLYREVIERCLSAKENLTGEEAGSLMEYVVGSLESLRV
jgi:serine/threonine protein kinase